MNRRDFSRVIKPLEKIGAFFYPKNINIFYKLIYVDYFIKQIWKIIMFFGEIKTKDSENCVLSNSIILDENGLKIKIKKGTVINKKIINLFLQNKIKYIQIIILRTHNRFDIT